MQGKGKKGAKLRRKVHLSLRLADLCEGLTAASFPVGAMVPAVVRTVEDTGSTCLLGVPGVSAFLPAAAFSEAFGAAARPVPGQIVQAVVAERLRDGASVVLSCDAAQVAAAATRDAQGAALRSLLPGQLVTVRPLPPSGSACHCVASLPSSLSPCPLLLAMP